MKTSRLFLLAVLLFCSSLALWSCGSNKDVPTTALQEVVKVETNTVIEYLLDTLLVNVPAETASNRTPEQSSHVETSLAQSDAWIDSCGMLNHTIGNKNQPITLPYDRPVERHDSIVYIEKPVPVEVPVPTERDFTKWEKFRLDWFGILAMIAAGLFCWTFRKPLISLMRLLKRP